jgi:uncharacterized protein (TIGR00369 family)
MNQDFKVEQTADGMTRAQAMLGHRGHAPMEDTLGFALLEIGEGRAVFGGTPAPHILNPMGIAHGGYAASMLDSACGISVLTTLAAGQKFSTLELKVAYHRAVDARTGPIRAEGVVLNRGRQVAYSEARMTDARGRLLASATSTLIILSP